MSVLLGGNLLGELRCNRFCVWLVPAELKRLWLCETGGSLTICTRTIIGGRRQTTPVRGTPNGALQVTRGKLQREC